MPRADFFRAFGLFVVEDFIEAELRTTLLTEVRSASRTPATVGAERDSYVIDEQVRKTTWADVSADTTSLVTSRLRGLLPALEQHFGLDLADCQVPQFLVYRTGDFYRAHRDRRRAPDAAGFSRERKLAAVLFLNSESDEPGPDVYGGGSLSFHDLLDDPRLEERGLPLTGEAGLLVAFSPNLLHQVTPVTHGERFTVVTWYR